MANKSLDPRAQSAIDFLRKHSKDWTGAIMPRWLPGALPPRSTKRGWRDAVSLWLLSQIISAHRVSEGGQAFFRGPLYQINRRELARQLCTNVDEISESANWLQQIGVIGLVHRTRLDDDGQPRGSMVFAFPIMTKLESYRKQYLSSSKTPEPIKYEPERSTRGQPDSGCRTVSSTACVVGGSTSAKRQFDFAEETASIVTAAKQRTGVPSSAGGGAGDDDDGGSGEAPGAVKDKQVPAPSKSANSAQRPPATAPNRNGHDTTGQSADAAPPRWRPARPPANLVIDTPEQRQAWNRASRLCTFYSQVMMRSGHARSCDLTHSDKVRAFKFFSDCPQSGALYVTSVFINALLLVDDDQADHGEGYDDIWYCRSALNFQKFLAYVKSGRIESEIGRAGWKINAWRELRLYFTESELLYYGWASDKIPIVRIKPDEQWESDPSAQTYYRDRNLPLPIEIQAIDEE
jgi:hypothetical protein